MRGFFVLSTRVLALRPRERENTLRTNERDSSDAVDGIYPYETARARATTSSSATPAASHPPAEASRAGGPPSERARRCAGRSIAASCACRARRSAATGARGLLAGGRSCRTGPGRTTAVTASCGAGDPYERERPQGDAAGVPREVDLAVALGGELLRAACDKAPWQDRAPASAGGSGRTRGTAVRPAR